MKFGGLKDIDYSDKGVLSRAIIENLKEIGCENASYCDSQLLNLFVCSKRGREYILTGNITPEQIQCLGVRPTWADYSKSDKLFNNVKAALIDYRRKFDSLPKVIYIEGLGIFAIGSFDEEVGIICDMADKMVDVLMRTIPFGGPKYLTKEQEKYLAG